VGVLHPARSERWHGVVDAVCRVREQVVGREMEAASACIARRCCRAELRLHAVGVAAAMHMSRRAGSALDVLWSNKRKRLTSALSELFHIPSHNLFSVGTGHHAKQHQSGCDDGSGRHCRL
jgi:hypothetical protein